MARYIFRLPDIGEGIAQAEIVAWHVKIGTPVSEDDRLADMMTDKATIEMESPVSGVIVELGGELGEIVAIGAPLVVIETQGEDQEGGREQAPSASKEPPKAASQTIATEDTPAPRTNVRDSGSCTEQSAHHDAVRVQASPAVRARARDLGVDLAQVRPAQDGRVRHSDLDAFLSYNASGGYAPAGETRADEQVRVIGLRKRIAQNMAASKRHIPHFSYVEEYDVTALEEARAQLNAGRGDRPRLTLLPLLITAICRLIPRYPMLNAHYDDESGVVTRFGAVHVGIATQTPAGLMVPVLRDAQGRNIWQLAAELTRIASAARDGTARSDELSGSTITLTSLGAMGGIATTPVINRPEVAIMGPNRIVERPVFVRDTDGSDRIAKRKLMNISMSCDHRVVDGWDAACFAQDLKTLIEAPSRILAG